MPAREDRLADVALEDLLRRRRLHLRGHVAVEERRRAHVDAAEEVGRGHDVRLELLLDRGARGATISVSRVKMRGSCVGSGTL